MMTTPTLRIMAQVNNCYIREGCVLCGAWDRPGEIREYLTNGSEDLGWVCPDCATLAPDAMRDRLVKRAKQLREEADARLAAAEDLEAVAAAGTLEVDPRVKAVWAEAKNRHRDGLGREEEEHDAFLERVAEILSQPAPSGT